MTPSRIGALAAIVLGVLALGVLVLRGGESHRYTLVFDDAGGLIVGNLLKVNGINMGTVKDIGVSEDQKKALIEVEVTELGPLREGTSAQIRATSLGGVVNKYIAFKLAPNNAKELADGTTLSGEEIRGNVGQDELVNAFDEKTREGLKQIVQGGSQAVEGRSDDLQTVLSNAPGALGETRRAFEGFNPSSETVRELVVNLAVFNGVVADRDEQLSRLTANSGKATAAIAGTNGTEFGDAIARLPSVSDEAIATLEQLPDTLDAVEELMVTADKNDAGMPAMLRQLTRTLNNGEPTIAALARSLNRKGENNDVADLLAASVALGEASERAGKSVPAGVKAATPLIAEDRAYTPDIVSAIQALGLVGANYDAAGHYLRLSPVFNVLELSGASGSEELISRSSFINRLQGVQTTTNRCPGGAAQATSDGSAPWTDGGKVNCNPGDVPPGP